MEITLNLNFILIAGIFVYTAAIIETLFLLGKNKNGSQEHTLFLINILIMGTIYITQNTFAIMSGTGISPYPGLGTIFDGMVALVVFTSLSVIKIIIKK